MDLTGERYPFGLAMLPVPGGRQFLATLLFDVLDFVRTRDTEFKDQVLSHEYDPGFLRV